jgi:ADP-heptose:LPS heptosyltransferase
MRILLSRTDAIGDVVLITPLIHAIKKKYPSSFLGVLVNSYAKEVIEGNIYVDKILVDEYNPFILAKKLKYEFDVAIIIYPRFHIALSTYLAKIKIRIGTAYRWYSFLFNKKIYVHRKESIKHEVEYNFDLLNPIGVKFNNENVMIFLNQQEKEEGVRILKDINLYNEKFVIVHPGMHGSAENLPIKKYAELIDRIQNECKIKVLITGSKYDEKIVKEIMKLTKSTPFTLIGKTNIKQLAAIISYSLVFISGSTGPMHISSAVGTPTISFFSKDRVTGPIRWRPWSGKYYIFQPEENNNMDSINLDKVISIIANITQS